jgi:hypothetical protein
VLHIRHPPTYLAERQYIYDIILREFLGLEIQTEIDDRQDVRITLVGDSSGRELIVADVLFATSEADWLTEKSLPKLPIRRWDLFDRIVVDRVLPGGTPIIYGTECFPIIGLKTAKGRLRLGLDLFGSAFFMLTRYEEIVRPVRDRHERFPAIASLAYQAKFLDRPVINEYVEILWWCLQQLWPRLERKQRTFRILLSHDVDWPVVTLGRTLSQTMKAAAGDLVKRRDRKLATSRLRSWNQVRLGSWDVDIGNTFDFIMTESARYGLRNAFYFIADHSAGTIDGVYTLDHPWIRLLLRRAYERGHEIGLHPSYNTFLDPARTKAEFEDLLKVCHELGINQPTWGGRQHYLRWRNPQTWQNYADAGLSYDSSLGFADEIGFRCGICYEYPVFNLLTRQRLSLVERPLIVMDATLLGDSDRPGGSISPAAAVKHIVALKDRCKQFEGDFTLLWHNTWLLQESQKAAYRECLSILAG